MSTHSISGMHKFEIKLPKIIKTKYNGPGWLFFYEEQKFITITTDHKIPQFFGTWPIQVKGVPLCVILSA